MSLDGRFYELVSFHPLPYNRVQTEACGLRPRAGFHSPAAAPTLAPPFALEEVWLSHLSHMRPQYASAIARFLSYGK